MQIPWPALALLLTSCAAPGGASPATTPAASVAAALPSASAAAAWAVAPVGTIGPDGRLYGADCPSARVFRIGANGPVVIAGSGPSGLSAGFAGDGGPATAAEVACPIGVAFDASGDLLFVDHLNNRVRKIDTHGIITTVAGSGPTGASASGGYAGDGGPATAAVLNAPYGIAIDRPGNLYITDRDNNVIRKVDVDGIITTFAGNGHAGYSGDGGPATAGQLQRPVGIAVDAAGNVYVADQNNNRVRRIGIDGIITTVAGTGEHASYGDGGPATAAALADPNSLVIDSTGNLYVSEDEGHRVRRIDSDGMITTFAGTGEAAYSGDGGPAAIAALNAPSGLAIDALGNVYIEDDGNFCIRKVDLAGLISSFWCAPR